MQATQATQTDSLAHCPLCGETLQDNPDACTKCDWVKGYRRRQFGGSQRDTIAAVLSLVPGLGHFYKGHKFAGCLFFTGTGLAIAAALLAATPTAGWGALILPFYWLWVMMLAYWTDDLVVPKKTGI
jgi:hypothetical protein